MLLCSPVDRLYVFQQHLFLQLLRQPASPLAPATQTRSAFKVGLLVSHSEAEHFVTGEQRAAFFLVDKVEPALQALHTLLLVEVALALTYLPAAQSVTFEHFRSLVAVAATDSY